MMAWDHYVPSLAPSYIRNTKIQVIANAQHISFIVHAFETSYFPWSLQTLAV